MEGGFASNLESLAGVYMHLNRLADAERLMREVVETKRRAAGGEENTAVATALYNLGSVVDMQKKHDEAEELFRRCLAIEEGLTGERTAYVAVTSSRLAGTLISLERYDEAELLLDEAMQLHREAGSHFSGSLIQDLTRATRISIAREEWSRAEEHGLEALGIAESKLGPDHPKVALVLLLLGRARESLGKLQQAELDFARSLEIREATLPPDHPAVQESRTALAALRTP
jgi:tetratricopeptide (TPR) repeat protein